MQVECRLNQYSKYTSAQNSKQNAVRSCVIAYLEKDKLVVLENGNTLIKSPKKQQSGAPFINFNIILFFLVIHSTKKLAFISRKKRFDENECSPFKLVFTLD